MRKCAACFLVILGIIMSPAFLAAQQDDSPPGPPKFALVIGNGAYSGLSRLANPVNDADDVAAALRILGFSVEKILNGTLDQMEDAVLRLKDRLSESGGGAAAKAATGAYGFFFYAGHGVQSGGENFLIPVDANIPNENYLRTRAVSVQTVLDNLNDANNSLNVVVLDACRDNPFGWSRSGNRGLAIVSRQPADSIIVYATSAGQQASDGDGRNGLFTSQLLPNLLTPGIEVGDVFKRTGADVADVSDRRQIPAIYNQFFGTAYLGEAPDETGAVALARPYPLPLPSSSGRAELDPKAAQLWTVGVSVGSAFAEPWLVGTLRGTLAPLKKSFVEIGFDLGMISGNADVDYSYIYPYVHYAYYHPFTWGGIHAGAGGGFLSAKYVFNEGERSVYTFAVDISAGVNLFDVIDISYTFRSNFKNAGQKISAGYTYRFK